MKESNFVIEEHIKEPKSTHTNAGSVYIMTSRLALSINSLVANGV
jgi:hypothetical protein